MSKIGQNRGQIGTEIEDVSSELLGELGAVWTIVGDQMATKSFLTTNNSTLTSFRCQWDILISKLLCLLIGHVPLNTISISPIPISFSQFCFHIFNFLIFKINSIGSSSLFIGYVPLNTVPISIHSHFIFTFIFSWFIGNVLLSKICQRTRNTSSFVTSFTWASKSDLLPIRKITVFGLVRLRASVNQDERWLYVDLKKRNQETQSLNKEPHLLVTS